MISNWLYAIAAVLAFAGSLRILFLLLLRRPVVARVLGIGLGAGELLQEHDMHAAGMFDGRPTTDDIEFRPTSARVLYEVDGISYRSDVCLIRHSGDRPEMTPIIWYDPRNPSRVTGIGPGWAMVMFIAAGGLVVFGMRFPF